MPVVIQPRDLDWLHACGFYRAATLRFLHLRHGGLNGKGEPVTEGRVQDRLRDLQRPLPKHKYGYIRGFKAKNGMPCFHLTQAGLRVLREQAMELPSGRYTSPGAFDNPNILAFFVGLQLYVEKHFQNGVETRTLIRQKKLNELFEFLTLGENSYKQIYSVDRTDIDHPRITNLKIDADKSAHALIRELTKDFEKRELEYGGIPFRDACNQGLFAGYTIVCAQSEKREALLKQAYRTKFPREGLDTSRYLHIEVIPELDEHL